MKKLKVKILDKLFFFIFGHDCEYDSAIKERVVWRTAFGVGEFRQYPDGSLRMKFIKKSKHCLKCNKKLKGEYVI